MAFTSDDSYLITCGITYPSAILIYDWKTGNVIVSTSIPSTIIDIIILRGTRTVQEEVSPLLRK
jgi:hypothetical protein